ncbi:hypothetical protein HU200_033149 [Digitaria exilis]|uniref:Uncharacterized protein n=1 Tax=Digitaria exilis TaxID=1010633 RepID=A0A835BLQ5_9POAL|nr:hypothetical protein HU200_033149 [Digitaria exilis]
MCYAALGKR